MASAARQPDRASSRASTERSGQAHGFLGNAKDRLQTPIAFWTKLNNDWVFNLSGLLAYNFLMSAFPILLVLLAIGGFILGNITPGGQQQLQTSIENAVPGGSALFTQVSHNLNQSAAVLLIVGIVVALFTGSRLFITLENCFGIVFRLRGRDAIHQNIMAIGMLLIYAILIPIVLLASVLPATIIRALPFSKANPVMAFFIQAGFIATSVVIAFILFAAIYVIVPNRPVRLTEVWKGTLIAAVLLVLYESLFPFYVSHFLKPSNYGSTAGFAVVILVFFYYLAFILLLGAEFNSWILGQRQTAGPLNAILHEVQAHNTTLGAAGPTAGSPQEDIQSGKGAPAMATFQSALEHEHQDHHADAVPSKQDLGAQPPPTEEPPARADQEPVSRREASRPGGGERGRTLTPPYEDERREQVWSYATPQREMSPDHSLTVRQRNALMATTTAGALAMLPVVGLLLRAFERDHS